MTKRGPFVNRAPLCATCRYLKIEEVTVYDRPAIHRSPWWKFWGRGVASPRPEGRKERRYRCDIAADPVTGNPRSWIDCNHERSGEYGCGPSGRNWVANPGWLAALRDSGVEVHPDLAAMIEAASAEVAQ